MCVFVCLHEINPVLSNANILMYVSFSSIVFQLIRIGDRPTSTYAHQGIGRRRRGRQCRAATYLRNNIFLCCFFITILIIIIIIIITIIKT